MKHIYLASAGISSSSSLLSSLNTDAAAFLGAVGLGLMVGLEDRDILMPNPLLFLLGNATGICLGGGGLGEGE